MSTRRTRSRLAASHSFHGQPGIQRFTRSTKPGAASSLLLDGKTSDATTPQKKTIIPVSATTPCLLTASPSKKRKLNEVDTIEQEREAKELEEKEQEQQQKSAVEDTPSKTIKFSNLSVSTPTRNTSRKRRSVHVDSSFTIPETSTRQKLSSLPREEDEEEEEEEEKEEEIFPAALDQFVGLHLSFLKTLGLHFTHKGPTAPADFKELLPSVEKLWKKRKVVIKDVQRIVHVWDGDDTRQLRFRIANYGLGKICLERVSGAAAGPVNENELHARFVKLVGEKWKKLRTAKSEDDGSAFVEALALAPIHESLTPFTALRKGQQRLQDLKGGVLKVKTAMMKANNTETNVSKTRDPTADRRKGLLERIKSKELLQSKLGPPPTKDQMLRRSAAQRAEDVASVLALLRPPRVIKNGSAAVQKKPFAWDSLIQTVQDSLRTPIPADEVAACLDILGQKDVAADWIDIVTVNKLKSVVLTSGYNVSPREIGIKVAKLKF
ncbi:hypothetical protein PISL3812_02362 [Talaromyces islandicus]|uniref:DNA replication factor Cdt1 C-terminal domain-containing protein n=1 Tax=Talaromyces islandicus TaxID=28573 RepID=A0A0U1LRH7_TALIS|nr:hypothetical protein PISL3812_02362 [Talaromyces islandicus]